jgi:hypothetical protein
MAVVLAGTVLVDIALLRAGAALGPWLGRPAALAASVLSGAASALLVSALGEWLVHRFVMHVRVPLPLLHRAYELHHVAHHWVQFPPDAYVHAGPVQYPCAVPFRPDRVCASAWSKALTVATHVGLYSVFAVPLVLMPAWLLTHNAVFATAATATVALLIGLFVRAHDAIHYPGTSRLERWRWFRFLDRHHYVHHLDPSANTNFLLPLGDLLMATLRRDPSAAELRRWPSYEQARARRCRPAFDRLGRRVT